MSILTGKGTGICLTLLVVAVGVTVLSWATDGWSTWTAEAARRRALLSRQTLLPNLEVQREDGEFTRLHDFDKPIVIVDFIFTRCLSACVAMGYQFSQLQARLAATSQANAIQFLSISFDHAHDRPEQLSAYLHRFPAGPGNWSALRVVDKHALEKLLRDMGVIVLPEPTLGYVHNTALYLVENHVVVGIYDVDNTAALLERITAPG